MDDREVNAVRALLEEARERGIGVAFLPDSEGWEVCYTWPAGEYPGAEDFELGAGRLSLAPDLETAVAAALRPLVEVADAYDRIIRKKSARRS